MLWQPTLPDEYLKASKDDLARRITARRKELGSDLVILGHHYQTDEVIRHADFTGDSLKLSQLAASKVAQAKAKYVVFCGVHFMAETADLLTPESVSVILPDLSAGCSMADMADYDDALAAWDLFRDTLKKQGWRGRIIPITYINSTAAIKAFVGKNGGIVCTSSNAGRMFEWAIAGGTRPHDRNPERKRGVSSSPTSKHAHDDIKLLFLPDQHLGRNTAAAAGMNVAKDTCLFDPRKLAKGEQLGGCTPEQLLRAKVILWAGHCSVHKLFRPEHCDEIRAMDRGTPTLRVGQGDSSGVETQEHHAERGGTHAQAKTTILVHPECIKEVVDKADLAGSTEFIIKTLREAPPGSRWAVGTEIHLVNRLAREAASRNVHVRILSDCQCLCTTMYRIDQEHLCWVLDNLAAGKVVNRVTVHPEARKWALESINRMLEHSAPMGAAPKAVKAERPSEPALVD